MSRNQLAALEAELVDTKQNLQAAIEQLETNNEELQATNEELVASNEELQSTNEELQSVNEELYTVNAEHTRKISELTELTNDMDNLLSSTDVGTIFLDRQLRIRKFTPQIAENFNLLAQDVGRPIETFTHRMHHPELMEDLRRVLASGEPVERELGDRDGRSHLLRVLPYRAKGTIQGVVLTLIDVTGMKAAEDALFHERYLLNSLLATVPDAIYFKDVRGRFIRANQVMARRLGLSDPAAAAGKSTLELVDQGAAAVWYEEDERVLKTGEIQTYKLEKREGAPGGSGWDLVTRLPLKDRNGSTVGVFGIFRDVTEQKLAEEKIQEAVRKRDEFLAMLSHELRNPLGAMVAATSLLGSEDVASHQRGRLVGVLERQSKQMARLLDDLLEASRVTQNKIELRKQVLDLRSVTHDAVEAVAGVMKERNLALTTEIDPEEIWVNGDPARLQQIQINLLSNAAKYTPRGGHVHLEVKRDGAEAVIRVRDDGIGIPKNMLETVFDLFVQSRHTLDRVEGGLGVGLTLVRSLVGMHGGTVKAYSEGEGRGAELDVRLPIALAGGRARELPKTQPRHADHVRVVVIEDNTDSRELLCELLLMAGFDCRSAGNGPDGLALAEEMEPSVVIADVGLPGMDGFELARRLRQNPKHRDVYLIALTGYGRAMDRETAMAAGFDRHLVKPFDTDELIRLLMDRTATEVGSPWRAHPAIERTAEAATTS